MPDKIGMIPRWYDRSNKKSRIKRLFVIHVWMVRLARTVDNDSFTVCRDQVLLFKHLQDTANRFT